MPLHLDLATPVSLLVLIGGGEFSFGETREIDELLLRSMPHDRRTIAFLPTASGSAEYAGHLGKYFHGIDPSVDTVNVPIYRGRDARRAKSLSALLSAGMIYLGGGVTNQLLATLRESPADMAIREAAANVGVILSGTGSVREHVQRLGRLLRKHADKQALLYEVVTRDTAEEFTSDRRRQHHAYQ